jgi:hypothetical protein
MIYDNNQILVLNNEESITQSKKVSNITTGKFTSPFPNEAILERNDGAKTVLVAMNKKQPPTLVQKKSIVILSNKDLPSNLSKKATKVIKIPVVQQSFTYNSLGSENSSMDHLTVNLKGQIKPKRVPTRFRFQSMNNQYR